jgi:hypothetical protein
MWITSVSRIAVACGLLAAPAAFAESMTVDEFRRELVGVPLCGTPAEGPLAGHAVCTVYLPDGTAVLAGPGILVRGIWEAENGQICRRAAHDAPERRRCVGYEQLGPNRYRNSDGVEVCLGPCPEPSAASGSNPPPK